MATKLIKQLRVASGAPMLDCKNAIAASGDDLDAAMTWLRKKGVSRAAKLVDRVTNAGLVGIRMAGNMAVLVEVNSETDFVARNEHFQTYVAQVADAALTASLQTTPSAATMSLEVNGLAHLEVQYRGSSMTATEAATELSAVVGEKVMLRRAAIVQGSVVGGYAHSMVAPGLGLSGSIVALRSSSASPELDLIAKRLAMHVVAARPRYLEASLVSEEVLAKESEILMEQMRESGKPENIIAKAIGGRLAKFAEEYSLRTQVHVVEEGKNSVEKFLTASATRLGLDELEVTAFDFCAVGDKA